jgi:Nif-specific regulatory protein
MENKNHFSKILAFFRTRQTGVPGDPEYNTAFCHILSEAAFAEGVSIWQLDSEGRLHMVFGTNVDPEEISDLVLRAGEGITGAAVLSRETIAVSDAWVHPKHDRRIDKQIDFRTISMISTPIIFGNALYGAVNILNHGSGGPFPAQWQERMSAVGVLYASALAASSRLAPYELPREEGVKNKKAPKPSKDKTVIVGVSRVVREALYLCVKAGKTGIPVLIRGETGTGKELAAHRIHEAGDRNTGPFLDVNCAALAETLLESELFGHVKGAFSGANRDRKGKFLAASGGTLFLDEIGEMSLACQAKILRVSEEQRITPVGSERMMDCDARIITATNQALLEKVEQGKFREDLYYRLCGIEILMPPLRERAEDISLLSMHFLNKACAEQRRLNPLYPPPEFSNEALEMLNAFNWPGNVRQLEQAIFAAVAICERGRIHPGDFPGWLHKAMKKDYEKSNKRRYKAESPAVINGRFNEERTQYIEALDETKYSGTGRWNLSAAARQLGIPRKTFSYRLKKMGIIQ